VRDFETGATRNADAGKPDFEGFLSPLVIEAYAEVMHFHRQLEDGTRRASDNWQLGIPMYAYMKSGWRHFFDWWKVHRGLTIKENIVFAIVQLIFNANGYLHELLKADPGLLKASIRDMDIKRRLMWAEQKTQGDPALQLNEKPQEIVGYANSERQYCAGGISFQPELPRVK
jgi:hypothetical protein